MCLHGIHTVRLLLKCTFLPPQCQRLSLSLPCDLCDSLSLSLSQSSLTMSDSETPFRKGDQVEVTKPHHHSYATTTSVATNGPYYPATVLRSHSTKDHHLLIQYQTLMSLHSGPYGPQLLTEYVHWARVRPIPPNDPHHRLKVGDSVDAFRGCSWVKGTVMDIYENSKYLVLFDEEEQELEIEQWNLRLHRNWVRGSWDPPLLEQVLKKKKIINGFLVLVLNFVFLCFDCFMHLWKL